ncbi:hypothetical protein HM131_02205 [Halobacillus mangrovi]|uniref:Uncharacterized protein n=2 Tax=Halobacillus mangrovi TaxID=402384 RepID=A0A1W5ZR07_9BACI|nr:hypothetical protein HM131_02205 [Halobacillus mangrovi]
MEGFLFMVSFFAIIISSLLMTRKCVKNGVNEGLARLIFGLSAGGGIAGFMMVLTRKVNDPKDVPWLFLIVTLVFGCIGWVNTKGAFPVREKGTFTFTYKRYNLLRDDLNLNKGIKHLPGKMKETWEDLFSIHKALPILLLAFCLLPLLLMTGIAVYMEWIKPLVS